MLEIVVRPELYHFDKVKEFANEFSIGEGDLVIRKGMERASLMTRWWKQ